jgi:hypothetical protein
METSGVQCFEPDMELVVSEHSSIFGLLGLFSVTSLLILVFLDSVFLLFSGTGNNSSGVSGFYISCTQYFRCRGVRTGRVLWGIPGKGGRGIGNASNPFLSNKSVSHKENRYFCDQMDRGKEGDVRPRWHIVITSAYKPARFVKLSEVEYTALRHVGSNFSRYVIALDLALRLYLLVREPR